MALLACLCPHPHLLAGPHEPLAAGTDRRADPRLLRAADDLRPSADSGANGSPSGSRTQRYELTSEGRRLAVFLTRTYTRILNPALAELDPELPDEIAARAPIASARRACERAPQDKIKQAAIAASRDDRSVNLSTANRS
jgi:hypothetical protein